MNVQPVQVQTPAGIHETENVHLPGVELSLVVDGRLAHVEVLRSDCGRGGRGGQSGTSDKTYTTCKDCTTAQFIRHKVSLFRRDYTLLYVHP